MIARAFAADLPSSRTGSLSAVASRDATRAAAFGAPRAHDSYESLLADDDVDAVYIATPHPLHAEWAIAAAEAGKHVLCEKPLTTSCDAAERVIEAAIDNDVFVMEAFMYRSHPQTEALLMLLEQKIVGEILTVDAVHCFDGGSRLTPDNRLLDPVLGGGAILDVGCYCVSGALLVGGPSRARIVDATARRGVTGVDLEATATLELDRGITATLWCAIDRDRPPALRIHGTAATIVVDTPWLPRGATTIRVIGPGVREAVDIAPDRGLYAYEADVVADAVAAGLHEGVPGWDESLATMRVLDEWRDAIA